MRNLPTAALLGPLVFLCVCCSGSSGSGRAIRVLSPNGGETGLVGSSIEITWRSANSIGNVDLAYSTDGGVVWTDIVRDIPNVGSYDWTIPFELSARGLVRVSETNGTRSDRSDREFTIALPSAAVLGARSAGGSGNDRGNGVVVTEDGSLFVVGSFEGSATFGAGEMNETTLVSAGGSDVFFAKFLSDARLSWARRAGGSLDDAGIDIAVGADGSFVVAGDFRGSMTFDAGEPSETVLLAGAAVTETNAFLARFDMDGTVLWATSVLTEYESSAGGVDVDAANSPVLVGNFFDEAIFASGQPGETLVHARGTDAFVAKYSADGSIRYVTTVEGPGSQRATDVSVTADGTASVIGNFEGLATFDPTTLQAMGATDVFVARYSADGNLAWVRQCGGASYGEGSAVSVGPHESTVVTGWFDGTFSFGESPSAIVLVSQGGYDMFVAKYDSQGNLAWAQSAGGLAYDRGQGVCVTPEGTVYVTGYFEDEAHFGAGEANETTRLSDGGLEMFLARYTPTGALAWATSAGGAGMEIGDAVVADHDGNALVTGRFYEVATFDTGKPYEFTLAGQGRDDVFLATFQR